VYGETRACGDQPAVAQLALDQVVTVDAVDEQLRVVADLLCACHSLNENYGNTRGVQTSANLGKMSKNALFRNVQKSKKMT